MWSSIYCCLLIRLLIKGILLCIFIMPVVIGWQSTWRRNVIRNIGPGWNPRKRSQFYITLISKGRRISYCILLKCYIRTENFWGLHYFLRFTYFPCFLQDPRANASYFQCVSLKRKSTYKEKLFKFSSSYISVILDIGYFSTSIRKIKKCELLK